MKRISNFNPPADGQILKVVIARTPMVIGGRGNLPEKIPTLGFGLARNDRGVKGFTLIELLIVIVIIGILSALIMANFVGIRERARDGRRKSDLRQMQSALELYRADMAVYPSAPLPQCGQSLSANSITYLQKIPCDPSDPSRLGYSYSRLSGGYTLIACLENDKDGEKDQPRNSVCSTAAASYTLNNP